MFCPQQHFIWWRRWDIPRVHSCRSEQPKQWGCSSTVACSRLPGTVCLAALVARKDQQEVGLDVRWGWSAGEDRWGRGRRPGEVVELMGKPWGFSEDVKHLMNFLSQRAYLLKPENGKECLLGQVWGYSGLFSLVFIFLFCHLSPLLPFWVLIFTRSLVVLFSLWCDVFTACWVLQHVLGFESAQGRRRPLPEGASVLKVLNQQMIHCSEQKCSKILNCRYTHCTSLWLCHQKGEAESWPPFSFFSFFTSFCRSFWCQS